MKLLLVGLGQTHCFYLLSNTHFRVMLFRLMWFKFKLRQHKLYIYEFRS